jgi:methionyl-tRNA formyltransferase
MKILFIGSVIFSSEILKTLILKKINIIGIITKKKSVFNTDHYNLAPLAKKNNIPYKYYKNINSAESINWIKKKSPDLIFCIGWSHLISKDILKIPSNGVIGYHPSDLPLNRGRNPLIWTIALGLKKSASTFFFITDKIDNGKIINKQKFSIPKNYKANDLYNKVIKISKKQIIQICFKIKNNLKIKSTNQKGKISKWRARTYKDGIVDWRMSGWAVHNLVNALSWPYPGASFFYKNKEYKLLKTNLIKNKLYNAEPGKIIRFDALKPIIMCGKDSIKIVTSKPKLNINKKDKYLN